MVVQESIQKRFPFRNDGKPIQVYPVVCDDCGEVLGYIQKEDYDNTQHKKLAGVICDNGLVAGVLADYQRTVYGEKKELCERCFQTEYCYCNDCNALIPNDDAHSVGNGDDYVCDSCYENYEFCDCCGNYQYDGGHFRTVNSRGGQQNWCPSCVDNDAFFCDCCEEWYDNDRYSRYDVWNHDEVICEQCANDDYVVCADCGNAVLNSDYYTDRGEYYCPNCWNDHYEEGRICGYHCYQTNWIFTCSRHERDTYNEELIRRLNVLHVGREIEIANGGEDYDNATLILDAFGVDEDQFRLSHDSSLTDGFEMISDPMTLEAEDTVNWEAGLKKARELGYVAHNGGECGLHFHMDRRFFADARCGNPETAMTIMMTNNEKWLKEFSRRKDFYYCAWISEQERFASINLDADEIDRAERISRSYSGHSRAMNYGNRGTIEMRFIRGTLKYSTMLAARQFVEIWANLVKYSTLEEICDVNLNTFKAYAEGHGYQAFLDYLEERHIA